jgi:hypothetical protein
VKGEKLNSEIKKGSNLPGIVDCDELTSFSEGDIKGEFL